MQVLLKLTTTVLGLVSHSEVAVPWNACHFHSLSAELIDVNVDHFNNRQTSFVCNFTFMRQGRTVWN